MSDDTISRRAAIEALEEPRKVPDSWTDEYAVGERAQYEKDVKTLNRLPSAQPERPEQPESAKEYCAECDHIEMRGWYPYEGCEFRSLPSAERTGRWIFNIDDQGWSWDYPYMCNQCGEWAEKEFKFCPNCGVKMEEGNE